MYMLEKREEAVDVMGGFHNRCGTVGTVQATSVLGTPPRFCFLYTTRVYLLHDFPPDMELMWCPILQQISRS
jgi:hypothetical protein